MLAGPGRAGGPPRPGHGERPVIEELLTSRGAGDGDVALHHVAEILGTFRVQAFGGDQAGVDPGG
ncbi:MAG: hypothetical protein M3063_11610 [Actinomycetota bacterium]|nr:hypothetical protein [Actinomycetota bacterium]